jgi:hypothetical protein
LLSVWPDVKLVMTHRHVGQVLPSYCSMCASLSINSSTSYRKDQQGAHWSRRFRTGLERLEALRGRLVADQIIDVQYEETVSDPIGMAEAVLAQLGITADAATRAALDACVKDNAREARPRHKYSADEFGLTPEGIEADFAFYHDKYLKK